MPDKSYEEYYDQAITPKYNGSANVVQANELIRSKQDTLTVIQAKLVRLAVSQIVKRDDGFLTYNVEVTKLSKLLGLDSKYAYRNLKGICEELMRKLIYFEDGTTDRRGNKNYKHAHWVEECEYRNGTITIKLSDSLKKYLVGLNELFTMYQYQEVLGLSSSYAVRLFELLSSYQNVKHMSYIPMAGIDIHLKENERIFTIEFLREFFNCENQYRSGGDFIRRVIDGSIKSINQNTIMEVEYRTIKDGAKIKYVVFGMNDFFDKPEKTRDKLLRQGAIPSMN